MQTCSAYGCFQPASSSAFYDVTACEDHLLVFSRFVRLLGRAPNAEELAQPVGRVLRAYNLLERSDGSFMPRFYGAA